MRPIVLKYVHGGFCFPKPNCGLKGAVETSTIGCLRAIQYCGTQATRLSLFSMNYTNQNLISRIFNGRIGRGDWLLGKLYTLLAFGIVFLMGGLIALSLESSEFLPFANIGWFFLLAAVLVVSAGLDVRRLHDFGKNWHWLVFALVFPLAYIPLVAFLLLKKGDSGVNKFGAQDGQRESLAMILNK